MTGPQPYDIDRGLAEVRRAREGSSPVLRESARIGDKLAAGVATNFTAAELELVGRVMVVVAASIGVLGDLPAVVTANIVGFAGQCLADGGGR